MFKADCNHFFPDLSTPHLNQKKRTQQDVSSTFPPQASISSNTRAPS